MLHFLSQPSQMQLGDVLREKLTEKRYKHFIIVSAFAKNSGVLRLKDSMQEFRNNGGSIDAFIGLDAHGTSYEAICNLMPVVNNLYLVHDNNPSITFHPKAYYLTDLETSDWLALGSNNLTGGGLWTNMEWATIIDVITKEMTPDERSFFESFFKQIALYKQSQCLFAHKIDTSSDLVDLVQADLLRNEIQLQIDAAKVQHQKSAIGVGTVINPFGTQGKPHAPRIKTQGKKVTLNERNTEVTSVEPIISNDNSEKMWFETREMTGGSRNILDLSMLGTLVSGTCSGTRYETNISSIALGSVAFFDIDPTNVEEEKDITINYKAKDYCGCTIKMHQAGANPNGSWRIQLKGETFSGDSLTTAEEGPWFVHKIIVLEKIRTDYFAMSVLPESELNNLQAESVFIARNGRNSASKRYGLLDI